MAETEFELRLLLKLQDMHGSNANLRPALKTKLTRSQSPNVNLFSSATSASSAVLSLAFLCLLLFQKHLNRR
jgi:uncharacterized protein with FMN-binding domain